MQGDSSFGEGDQGQVHGGILKSQITQISADMKSHFGGQSDALETIEIKSGEKDILSKAVKVAEFFLNAGGTAK